MLENAQLDLFFQLLLAMALGGLVGLEREYKRKEAGLKTYALVALGAALLTIISFETFNSFAGQPGVSFDPSRVANSVAVGLGFIGAGIIIYRNFHVEGLTTAAGLWTVGAIGTAVGAELYWPAVFATLLALLVLSGLSLIERLIFKKSDSYE